jgi:hypothetical protein
MDTPDRLNGVLDTPDCLDQVFPESLRNGRDGLAVQLEQYLPRLPTRQRSYLTECIDEMVVESQLLHKIVDLLSTITMQDNKLTSLWGSRLSITI